MSLAPFPTVLRTANFLASREDSLLLSVASAKLCASALRPMFCSLWLRLGRAALSPVMTPHSPLVLCLLYLLCLLFIPHSLPSPLRARHQTTHLYSGAYELFPVTTGVVPIVRGTK